MFRLDLGRTAGSYCDGVSRRSFLQLGVAGMASLGLPQILRAKAESAPESRKNTSVIMVWLDGAFGHMDTFDMKPEAPEAYRGLWKPIRTNVAGIDVTELFPKQARVADKFSVIRSLHHGTGDHFAGAHRMLTTKEMGVSGANQEGKFPAIGSLTHRAVGARRRGMPGYVGVPYGSSVGLRPGYFGANSLGTQHNPFDTGDPSGDGFRIQNLNLAAGLNLSKLEDRRSLISHFDTRRKSLEHLPDIRAMDRFHEEAYEFVTGAAARTAFDISREDVRLRDQYGRNTLGQSALLARRLVEAGSTFVTVHSGGWDHHWDLKASYERMLPQVDAAMATLFTDLEDRGMLETTMVILCGEFGRTPKMNDGGNGGPAGSKGTPGRDHWGDAMSVVVGGGGIKGGTVVGSTDKLGERPKDRPLTPCNLHATIYDVLGIDPKMQLLDPTGRPVNVLDDPTPIQELL